jgi:hypothetical protein
VNINTMPQAVPPELAVNMTGLLNGKAARILKILGRRSLGWTTTTLLEDVANYLDTSQPRVNDPDPATTYYLRSSSANDTLAGTERSEWSISTDPVSGRHYPERRCR